MVKLSFAYTMGYRWEIKTSNQIPYDGLSNYFIWKAIDLAKSMV